MHGGDGSAHFSGTERCGSIWACPVCSAVIRAERAGDIAEAVRRHEEAGGRVLLLTLTVRHRAEDALATSLDAVLSGWREVVTGAPWKRWADRLGLVGYVRAVEITHGEAGWHPHAHVLLFTEQQVMPADMVRFRRWVYERWADRVEARTGRVPDFAHGVDLKTAGGTEVGQYLAKVQDTGLKTGMELARSDLKGGHQGNRMPFELLDAPNGDVVARDLWLEYVRHTKGRRAITWSRHLRDRLGMTAERTDDEIVEDTEAAERLAEIEGTSWDRLRDDPDRLASILEAAEQGDVVGILALARAVLIEGDLVDLLTGEVLTTGPPGFDRTPPPPPR